MLDHDSLAFVRSTLGPPPLRVPEIGAGKGELAAALRAEGYEVNAIDPGSETPDVLPIPLIELRGDQPFDAAVAAPLTL